MERTLSVNYPVIRQNKGALLKTFEKHHGRKIRNNIVHQNGKKGQIDRMYRKESNDCFFTNVFNNTPLFCLSTE